MAKKLTTEEFIEKARRAHGDKYDYSKVDYVNNSTPVTIICKKHGEFKVRPVDFLRSRGGSCKLCKNEKLRKDRQMGVSAFIEKSKKIHGDNAFYYKDVIYVNNRTKVVLTCQYGHIIEQTPDNHFKYGCYKCAHTYQPTTEEFIEKAKKVHGDRYDYSKVNYVNSHADITIICKKHGEFTQAATEHLSGRGCPNCANSLLEEKIRTFLIDNNINFIQQAKFDWLKNHTGKNLSFDFYLPEQKIAIECQGIQHFQPVDFFGGDAVYKDTIERDELKLKLSQENNIKVIYYTELSVASTKKLIRNIDDLKKEIQ